MVFVQSEIWSLMTDLITRSAGQSVTSEVDKIRAIYPVMSLEMENVVCRLNSFIQHVEEEFKYQLVSTIYRDIFYFVKKNWCYSATSLRICSGNEESYESIATACRVALQESWFSDLGSLDLSCSKKNTEKIGPVIYLSPAAPRHLRRWLSLNLCCPNLLVNVLPTDQKNDLPTISVPLFRQIIHHDLQLGRQPLLVVAYAGSTMTGSSDCLQALAHLCRCHRVWLHVEGLSFLRTSPTKLLTTSNWMTNIKSVNLEISRYLGLPRPVTILLLLQCSLPESILLYLSVFPLSAPPGESSNGPVASFPHTFPTSLCEVLLVWIFCRLYESDPSDHLRHADRLTAYTLKQLSLIDSLQICSPQIPSTDVDVDGDSVDANGGNNCLPRVLDESLPCPVILFRYILPFRSTSEVAGTEPPTPTALDFVCDPEAAAGTGNQQLQISAASSVQDFRNDSSFLNGLNTWFGSALQFEHPNLSIKSCLLPKNSTLFLRFSLLDAANLLSLGDAEIDTLITNIRLNCLIMETTWKEKDAFINLVNSTPGLYYYDLRNWAGLGAAFYVPYTYRYLLAEVAEAASLAEHQRLLADALLRLPIQAVQSICDLNRDLMTRLRNHDFAFSSVRISLCTDVGSPSRRPTSVSSITEALDTLTSSPRPATRLSASTPDSPPYSPSPIGQPQYLNCLRFGLITPGTDTAEIVQLVLRMAKATEEDSKYTDSLSEVVKRGIEEATLHMQKEQIKKLSEQGVLRQVPYLDRLINWWSPQPPIQTHGRSLNLSVGELVSTESLVRTCCDSVSQEAHSTCS